MADCAAYGAASLKAQQCQPAVQSEGQEYEIAITSCAAYTSVTLPTPKCKNESNPGAVYEPVQS